MTVVFLVGGDTESTRRSIEQVCRLTNVKPVAVLVDTAVASWKRRFKNLSGNVRKNGWSYLPARFLEAAREVVEGRVERAVVSPAEVRELLKKAFPDRCFSLAELGAKYQFAVRRVGNLNGPVAIEALKECQADLGIVLGTRILKPAIFSVPRMGCINLHKGKVPEYRGMPPGFWELYDGAKSAGVTVHFVDQHLDTGDIVSSATVPIEKMETPASLRQKLDSAGVLVLAEAVSQLRDGTATPLPQSKQSVPPKRRPSLSEIRTLRARLPHWHSQGDLYRILKGCYSLFIYYSGIHSLIKVARRGSRGVIFLYHRVDDFSYDPLTVDTETFAGQLLALSKHYRKITTRELVELLAQRKSLPPTSVTIHFDDCYRDVLINGAPILEAAQFPATAFISSGFVDTDRRFQHDLMKYPFTYPLLKSSDVREWANRGFEVGAHTVNHVDLGKCEAAEAVMEITQSGSDLEGILGTPVTVFSFPFGKLSNIRKVAVEAVRTRYGALFSAYGGFIGPDTDPFDIPRVGANHALKPLSMLLTVEGLAADQIAARLRLNRDSSGQPL